MGDVFLRVSALEKLVLELKRRQLDAVQLFISEDDPDDPDQLHTLFVTAANSVHPDTEMDYDLESDPVVARLFRE